MKSFSVTRQEAKAIAARVRLEAWAKYVDRNHVWPVHLRAIADALHAVEEGKIKRLIVMLPPRHGKSETISAKFPAWFIGRDPNRRVILTSHTASLAIEYSLRNREYLAIYGQEVFGPSVRLSDTKATADDWRIYGRRGGLRAAGVGGSITGRGADLLILDDPHSNYQEAHSKTQRDHIWDWWRAVALTRLEPGGATIIVSTRWHEDDLVGRVLRTAKETGEKWTVLRMPALAEEGNLNDPTNRKPGEALWRERYPEEKLHEIQKTVGAYFWAAIYQQNPQPMEGGLFKREQFRYFTEDAEFFILHRPEGIHRVRKIECWSFQTVDLAASTKETADYFVIATWVVTPGRDLLLEDVLRVRAEGPDQRALMQRAYMRYKPAFIGIERTGYQLTFVQEMCRSGLPVKELVADRDKVARALPMAARYEAGTVYHKQDAAWLGDYEDELLHFPQGEHDDQVDCAGYAALELAAQEPLLDISLNLDVGRRANPWVIT